MCVCVLEKCVCVINNPIITTRCRRSAVNKSELQSYSAGTRPAEDIPAVGIWTFFLLNAFLINQDVHSVISYTHTHTLTHPFTASYLSVLSDSLLLNSQHLLLLNSWLTFPSGNTGIWSGVWSDQHATAGQLCLWITHTRDWKDCLRKHKQISVNHIDHGVHFLCFKYRQENASLHVTKRLLHKRWLIKKKMLHWDITELRNTRCWTPQSTIEQDS